MRRPQTVESAVQTPVQIVEKTITQPLEAQVFATNVNDLSAVEAFVRAEAVLAEMTVEAPFQELSVNIVETMGYEQNSLQPLPEIISLTDAPEAESIGGVSFAADIERYEYTAEAPAEVVLDRFIEALQITAIDRNEDDRSEEGSFLDILADNVAESAPERPPIVSEVFERLAALEPAEKEIVLPVVQQISLAVAEVSILQQAEAPAEKVAVAEEKIAELVVEFFEAIGLEHNEEKVQKFVQVLLTPELAMRLAPAKAVWLEGVGTHEVKRRLQEFFAMMAGLLATIPTSRLLGMFAVFNSRQTAPSALH